MLKHLVETCCMHEEDYAELIRMNANMMVLKHRAETRTKKTMGHGPTDSIISNWQSYSTIFICGDR
jgi:hypothetical protein